jgi:tRNA-dihydrouridine synthase
MADVTDRAYRFHLLQESGYDAIDVLWTEFVAVDGLVSRGKYQLMRDLQYSSIEQPKLVAQIFGGNPDKFGEAVSMIVDLGYQAIDINMGCPDKSINKQGAGACMIQHPDNAVAVIAAAKAAAGNIPISVKTRIGWSRDESRTWIPQLLDAGIDALTIHARTRSEMSDYPPHWDIMRNIVEMAQPYSIPVVANGGILTTTDGDRICTETGAHGYMVGKGTFGNPYFFKYGGIMPDKKQRLESALLHLRLYYEWVYTGTGPDYAAKNFVFGDTEILVPENVHGKSLELMKKNFRCYITDWSGASELRAEIMNEKTFDGLVAIFEREIAVL